MTSRTWHKGPPPHVGWWVASIFRIDFIWRWWDGKNWSVGIDKSNSPKDAARFALERSSKQLKIEWKDYYPQNARVLRIDPSKGKVK